VPAPSVPASLLQLESDAGPELKQVVLAVHLVAPLGKEAEAASGGGGVWGGLSDILFGSTGPRGGKREGVVDAIAKSAARSVGSSLGRQITRGVLGSLLGGKR